jgi:hypothetical protein
MPALSLRFTGGTAGRVRVHVRDTEPREPVSAHLAAEFLTVSVDTVERCVSDVWACAEHLGINATPAIVERVAREHLLAMVNSTPRARNRR